MSTRVSAFGLVCAGVVVMLGAGCGCGQPATTQNATVRISPEATQVSVRQTRQFAAQVSGVDDTGVRWSVEEGEGGVIDSTGLYQAPEFPGIFHVIASSRATPKSIAVATVTVVADNVAVTINPSVTQLGANQALQFTASVTGSSNTAVTWSVEEGSSGGTVTSGGYYVAPATPGQYHVIATAAANPTKRAVATVAVVPITITIIPPRALVEVGSTQTFMGSVLGAANTGVTWAVREGVAGGSINAQGVYTPPTTLGQYHIVATSVADPTRTATAVAEVIQPVAVSITPATANLSMQQSLQFAAAVSGSTNQNVAWSIKEGGSGGTISVAGLYTAPVVASTQVFHVVATPQANPAKAAEAVVTVAPGLGIQISPSVVTLSLRATQQFSATVTGATNTAVNWAVQEGATGGTITSGGLYTAPAESGTWHVVATSQADLTKRAVATIIVLGEPVEVSGTVSYAGSKGGRVYVILAADDASYGIAGTSVTLSGNSATFTLRGVTQRGDFAVRAFMDTMGSGMYHPARDPYGTIDVRVSGALRGVNVTMAEPEWDPFFSTAAPTIKRVVPADGAVLVSYEPAWDVNGNDECPRYSILWSDQPQVSLSNNLGSLTFTSNAPRVAVVRGLTNGERLYFTMRCPDVLWGDFFATETGPVTVGPSTGGFTLSGVVKQSGTLPNNPDLYVVAMSKSGGFMTRIASPATSQPWSMAGLSAGNYRVTVFRDVSNDGKLTPLDPNNFFEPEPVSVQSNQTAPTIELSSANAIAAVLTGHDVETGSESYQMRLRLRPNLKQPVRVLLETGTKVAVPLDLPIDETGGARHMVTIPLGSISPAVADRYTFAVTYSDGTSETLTGSVTTLLPAIVMKSPSFLASSTPVFEWAPLVTPVAYTTSVTLYDWTYLVFGSQAIGSISEVPMGTTAVSFQDLNPRQPALESALHWYRVVAMDNAGNWTRRIGSFIAQ